MKKLLNVLYVTIPNSYLALKGENINVLQEGNSIGRVPLHNLEGICAFGYQGVSPALMEKCVNDGIGLVFFTKQGRFQAKVSGPVNGNVTLRKTQYRYSDDEDKSLEIAKMMILGKVYNARKNMERLKRDHALRINYDNIGSTIERLKVLEQDVLYHTNDLESLRGFEGQAATIYFSQWNEWILNQKEAFFYRERTRRPPLDPLNALLSFAYTLLTRECASALEGVGLDSYVGFLHRDRPGRVSLALDLMEELRPVLADRFVIKLINQKQIKKNDFHVQENSAVILKEDALKKFIKYWQEEKEKTVQHPFLKLKVKKGLLPHVQSLLLARFLRGDLDTYPPYLMR
ncbi:type I-C CRISPR-associated endonuclease Cas1c [Ornithinibacillus sp. 4-3]|uniref:CRISPR-associated endonuclease Cas1 n=1 Tax=Ornithinibacillus sp. 4-3 TaxID=3231488 RepID=A0AB39HRL0_9BACI